MSFRKVRLICLTIILVASIAACLLSDLFVDGTRTREGWGQWTFLAGVAVVVAAFWAKGDES